MTALGIVMACGLAAWLALLVWTQQAAGIEAPEAGELAGLVRGERT